MIKKILIAADSGSASANALEIAIQIARNNKAILQILHVTDNSCIDYNSSEDKTKVRYALPWNPTFHADAFCGLPCRFFA